MKKTISHIFISVILISTLSFSQGKDSTIISTQLFQNSDSTIVVSDSLIALDSLKSNDSSRVIAIRDSLVPLKVMGYYFENNSKIGLTQKQIVKNDYRYSGNIFTYLPFGFLQDLGSRGQPSEVMNYGLGYGHTSYTIDGKPLNNSLLNSFDLNLFRSESIDSLELLPITKGFLYSLNNNSVAVNFITRDKVENIPYSRLRYYQSSDKEGYLDGIFNLHLFPKLNFEFNFTNSSVNSRYANTEYSGWKVSSKIKYMPSNKLNIIGKYRYVKSTVGLNGGVDYQSIIANNQSADVNTILYDPFQAPVKYGKQLSDSPRYQKTTGHNFNVTLLTDIVKSMPTSIDLYYQFNQIEFRQNEKKSISNLPYIFHNNTFYSGGAILRQLVDSRWFSADLIGAYNQTKYDSPLLKFNDTKNTISAAGSFNIKLLNDKIVPSFFAKYMNYSGTSYEGIGAGLNINYSDNLNSNFSVSRFSKPYSILEEQYLSNNNKGQNITAAQAFIKYNSTFVKGSIGYFYYNNDSSPLPVIDEYTDTLQISEIGFYNIQKIIRQGINVTADVQYSNILFSANLSYYFGNSGYKNIPDFSLNGGIYYVDTLFNSNLKLKTGINIYYSGKQNYFQYDFEKSTAVSLVKHFGSDVPQLISNSFTKQAIQLDYFLAGTIKDAATIYIVFQNLLDSQYFIVPYYPKQSRGIRFGVSWELYN